MRVVGASGLLKAFRVFFQHTGRRAGRPDRPPALGEGIRPLSPKRAKVVINDVEFERKGMNGLRIQRWIRAGYAAEHSTDPQAESLSEER
jgi:hypothetical protein